MNRPSQTLCAVLMLFIPIWLFGQTAHLQPQPTAIEGATTYVYKSVDGTELRLHVFNPPNHHPTIKRSAIVFFFGGDWVGGTLEQFVPQSKYLAERGMVAIVADYRVFNRHKTSPFESMADAKSAIRWVRSHAGELGVDPNRIAAGGGSAGGHLALSSAVFDGFDETKENSKTSSKPNALVLFNPVVDTTYERMRERFGDRGREASPIHHIARGLPPMVIFHGKADTAVPFAEVEKFCAEDRAKGNKCQLFGYEGAHHGFFNPQHEQGKWYRETLLEADRFLTEIGYLPEPASAQIP
jgi:acetyl esterase